jgi:hypothetical protein
VQSGKNLPPVFLERAELTTAKGGLQLYQPSFLKGMLLHASFKKVIVVPNAQAISGDL